MQPETSHCSPHQAVSHGWPFLLLPLLLLCFLLVKQGLGMQVQDYVKYIIVAIKFQSQFTLTELAMRCRKILLCRPLSNLWSFFPLKTLALCKWEASLSPITVSVLWCKWGLKPSNVEFRFKKEKCFWWADIHRHFAPNVGHVTKGNCEPFKAHFHRSIFLPVQYLWHPQGNGTVCIWVWVCSHCS